MNAAYKEEEEFWSQKARINWLREGDRNTKYFHAATAERRKRNRLDAILDESGIKYEGEEEIAGVFTKFFENLFSTSSPTDCEEILESIPKPITETMNRNLTRAVDDQEIKEALFSIHPKKSPGPDGITPLFFSKILAFNRC